MTTRFNVYWTNKNKRLSKTYNKLEEADRAVAWLKKHGAEDTEIKVRINKTEELSPMFPVNKG